jgi:hypothetical protein
VAVDAPVVSVDEINPLLGADGGARCEQDDKAQDSFRAMVSPRPSMES